jgi:hypothetical protein
MAVLDDLGAFMVTNVTDTSLTLGTNLFLGRMPTDPDTCVAIYETGGSDPTDVFGSNSAPPIENAGVMCHTRAAAYSDCQSLAVDIMKTLSKVINETLTSTYYYKVEPIQSPFGLDRDDQDRMVFSCNFSVAKAL